MQNNRLTLKLKNTMEICIGSAHTLGQNSELDISHKDSTRIELFHVMKYLGIILDDSLTFKDHVQYIKKKATSRLKMLRKPRAFVTSDTSLQLYKILDTQSLTMLNLFMTVCHKAVIHTSKSTELCAIDNLEMCPLLSSCLPTM